MVESKATMPEQIQKAILENIQNIQGMKDNQDGVWLTEIFKYTWDDWAPKFSQPGVWPMVDISFIQLVVTSKIRFNKDFTKFSVIELEGYRLWSDLMTNEYKGYALGGDITLQIKTAPKLNYKKVIEILKKPGPFEDDEEIKSFEQTLSENGSCFLDNQKIPQIFAASLMRSGNTLIRRIMERVTGIVTGTNGPNFAANTFSLLAQGLKGEQVFDNRVWILKTHFPYQYPMTRPMNACRAFVIVRNPVDVIVSQWMLVTTVTHTQGMKNDFVNEFPEEWNEHVKSSIKLWNDYHQYWLGIARDKKIPIHFLRFEDLIANQRSILEELFEYLLAVDSIKGLYIEHRLNSELDSDPTKNGAYVPRSGKVGGGNFKYFTKEQIEDITKQCKEYMTYFGYDIAEDPESEAKYKIVTADEDREDEQWQAYKKLNEETRKWVLEKQTEIEAAKLTINQGGKESREIPANELPVFKLKHLRPKLKMD